MSYQTNETVYYRDRSGYFVQGVVDHCYTSTNGTACVGLWGNVNVVVDDVLSFEEYWEAHRADLDAIEFAGV